MPIAPITQLSYPQKPGALEQLGTGILDPLNQYTSTKLNQLLERQNAAAKAQQIGPGLQNILGLSSPEVAQQYGLLAAYNPELIKPLIQGQKNLATSGDIGVAAEGLNKNARVELNKMAPGFKQAWFANYLENPTEAVRIANASFPDQAQNIQQSQQLTRPIEKALKTSSQAAEQAQLMQAAEPTLKKESEKEQRIKQHYEQKAAQENAKKVGEELSKPEKRKTALDYMQENPKLSRTEANLLVKRDIEDEKADKKAIRDKEVEDRKVEREKDKLKLDRESDAYKFNEKLINDSLKLKQSSKRFLDDLSRMEELEPDLDTAGYSTFLKEAGLDIPALLDPASEEFNKVAANFQRGAKEIYGARITNTELEQFLKTIPSLSMSPEGRKRVIANLRKIYQGNIIYADTLKEIIKNNKSVPPLDLNIQIDDEIGPKLDKITEQFKKDLAKPVPPAQHKLKTFGQALAGKALGKAGTLAKAGAGAFTGYKIGSKFGPLGGLGGAAIGGLLGAGGLTGFGGE